MENVIDEIKKNLKNLKRDKENTKKPKRNEADRRLDDLWKEINQKKREVARLKGDLTRRVQQPRRGQAQVRRVLSAQQQAPSPRNIRAQARGRVPEEAPGRGRTGAALQARRPLFPEAEQAANGQPGAADAAQAEHEGLPAAGIRLEKSLFGERETGRAAADRGGAGRVPQK